MNSRLVGWLRKAASGAIDFRYDESWLVWEHGFPVSLSMPLREDFYVGDPVAAVFDNLLPDNFDIRDKMARFPRGAVREPPLRRLLKKPDTAQSPFSSCAARRSASP